MADTNRKYPAQIVGDGYAPSKEFAQRLNSLTLAFREFGLERNFLREHAELTRNQARGALIVAITMYLLFGVLDPQIVGTHYFIAWGIRAIVCVLVIVAFFVLSTPIYAVFSQQILLLACIPIGGGILALLQVSGDAGRSLYYAGIMLVNVGLFVFFPIRFIYGLLSAIILSTAYLIQAYAIFKLPGYLILNNMFFVVGAAILTGFAGYMIERSYRWNYYQKNALVETQRELTAAKETAERANSALAQSLEFETATSEVLHVISSSPGRLEPVYSTMLANALKHCEASSGGLFKYADSTFRPVAGLGVWMDLARHAEEHGVSPGLLRDQVLMVPSAQTSQILDMCESRAYRERAPFAVACVDVGGVRALLYAPLLKDGKLTGCILLFRQEARPFSEKQMALVTSFARQVVIAIENTRLFEEVQARNRDLTALGEVGRAVSSTLDLQVVLKTIVDRAVELSGTDAGSLFYYRKEIGVFELGETTGLDKEVVGKLRKLDISARETGLGEAIANQEPLQIPDLTKLSTNPLREAAIEIGFRASLIVPLLGADGPVGTLVLQRRQPGEFSPSVVRLMQSFADQSAIALENARLFEEIARKSRELEVASQHKSQFVANMSHELRTPLAAILGYAELMEDGYYEPQGPKSLDALNRVCSNGKHLLSLINTVLDIAKIESGQFKLSFGEYALGNVVETVRAATESLAETKKLGLKTDVATPLPIGMGDEQRLTQVLLNLVGNAIKFTDKGEVRITATVANSHFAVSVTDTGPGIPIEEQKRIFEQFHQVDSSNTKAKGGTGLGLAIARQIVEMHGGRIWVESVLGKGATFQMEFPVRVASQMDAA